MVVVVVIYRRGKMTIGKIRRDNQEFSTFQNTSKKSDIDDNFNNIIDKLNEIINVVNKLDTKTIETLTPEYYDKFLYADEEGNIIGKDLETEDIEVATVKTLPPNFIDTEHIQNGAITGANIAPESITSDHIQENAITNRHIQEQTITPDLLAQDFKLTADKIEIGTIDGGIIEDETIPVDKLNDDVFERPFVFASNKADFYLIKNGELQENCIGYLKFIGKDEKIHFKIMGTTLIDPEQQIQFKVIDEDTDELLGVTEQAPIFYHKFNGTNDFVMVLEMKARQKEWRDTKIKLVLEENQELQDLEFYGEVIAQGTFVQEAN